jgi:NAD+ kinase
MTKTRAVLFIINSLRDDAKGAVRELENLLEAADFNLFTIAESELADIAIVTPETLETVEIEAVRGTNIPLLGINLGHVGFLAEVEKPSMAEIAESVIAKNYLCEKRMVLAYSVVRDQQEVAQGWALNEVTIERNGTTMVQLFLQIDNRPISRWGCDGLICSTPTGSTAYAFSAGGPVVWPEVEALVLLPISAHALFARPMVISPESTIVVDIESCDALLSGDSLRKFALKLRDRVTMTRDPGTVQLAHLKETLFSDRLVAKFKLPVEGWRGE